ncbi:DUF3306 domain-containing protein [Ramlibacter sp.]|uniref:DUF3306 domain-containing protein n=1 Tax=Ramlibacter sp. TaxID=1917967 RepID=UPI0017E75B8E|nr:DUF3306 domain-containing protein [Ramlibacter sp.]MBA2673867.1 DUF3306 domain-containing protein [Ramlibacter sp.]
MSEEGFFGRWSKRKLETKEAQPRFSEPVRPEPVEGQRAPETGASTGSARTEIEAKPPVPTPEVEAKPPAPTLADTQALTPQSDFRRFVTADVDPQVKNAALKKLFADPHFNVMDGLDTYIDDYSKPDPLPAAMARQLASAKFLKLFDDDEDEEKNTAGAQGREVADDQPPQSVAQSSAAAPAPPPDTHADPDLRLQQDDAPGPAGPGAKPG